MPGREREDSMGAESAGIRHAVPSQFWGIGMDCYRDSALPTPDDSRKLTSNTEVG